MMTNIKLRLRGLLASAAIRLVDFLADDPVVLRAMAKVTINAGAVTGLELAIGTRIDDALKNLAADDIDGIEDAAEAVAERVVERELNEFEIDSDKVDGLDRAISSEVEDEVKRQLGDGLDCDSIKELDGFVRGIVEEMADHIGRVAINAVRVRLTGEF